GRVHVVADLQQVNHGREQARVIDVLDVVEPDAGSVAVVCMDALKEDARPVACPQATAFWVAAKTDGQLYGAFAITVNGRAMEPAKVIQNDAIDTTLTEIPLYPIALARAPHPVGPITIGLGSF